MPHSPPDAGWLRSSERSEIEDFREFPVFGGFDVAVLSTGGIESFALVEAMMSETRNVPICACP
ncbi:hypothetical protein [Paeniglutamicibacter gangotriensis]|uniref:hypothetical protein n=1 Tax=Paeniglutamicibacter gangotriensis TaxID=254787 RepID=UPI00034CA28B|nr:hypothetical protein [Paeniglutamicibacter gangotriensis]